MMSASGSSLRAPATLTLTLTLGLLGGGSACVFADSATSEFDERRDISGVDTVRLDLPDSDVRVGGRSASGEGEPAELRWVGRWVGYGGTEAVAREHAESVALEAEVLGRTVRLAPRIPADAQGLVGLELDGVEMPSAADLELRCGLGEVVLEDLEGAVSVVSTGGEVRADTSGPGLDIWTEGGGVEARTSGYLEVYTGFGNLVLEQRGAEEDVVAQTDFGSIELVIPADAKVSFDIQAREIRVDTPLVATVTTGRFERQTDLDGPQIRLSAPAGEVVVTTP